MPLSHTRASTYTAPTNVMALGHPWVSPAYNDTPGIPIGIDALSRELVMFDPWKLMDEGYLNTIFGIIFGLIRHGKSSTMKIIAIRLMLIAAGYERMRIAINDHKPEGKGSEYQKLTELTRSKTFAIATAGVNPFDPDLYLTDQGIYNLGVVGMAEMFAEYLHGERLVGSNAEALRVAMYAMLQASSATWGVRSLHKHLIAITREQIAAYRKDMDVKLEAELKERLTKLEANAKSDPEGSDKTVIEMAEEDVRRLVSARANDNDAEIQHAGVSYVGPLFAQLLEGSYGQMFGSNSLYHILTQRAVTYNWLGARGGVETLGRLMLTNIKMSAIEQGLLSLIPHVELDDEKHRSMDNLLYATTNAYESEIARGIHTFNFSATHRPASIRKGGVGSPLYGAGQTILRNSGFAFLGKQNDDPEVLDEFQELYGLTDWQANQLPILPDYTFGLKLGQAEPLRFVRIFATPQELPILGTSAATERMVTRPDVYNDAELEEFARRNGVVYLGERGDREKMYV